MRIQTTTKIYLVCALILLGVIVTNGTNHSDQRLVRALSRDTLNENGLIIDATTRQLHDAFEHLLNVQDEQVRYAYIGSEWESLQSKPNVTSASKDQIPYGQPVVLIQTRFGWTEILTRQGTRGWVRQTALVDSKSPKMTQLISSRYHDRSSAVDDLVETAKAQLGKPYVWGATGPRTFDCSGFVQYVYRQHGIQMPRVSADQALVGRKVNFETLNVGDLVFFDTRGDVNGNVSHVGIYIGEGSFIHASSGKSAMCVTISSFDSKYYKGRFLYGRRVF